MVIGVDATGSMSGALTQVLNNIRECVERTYKVLKRLVATPMRKSGPSPISGNTMLPVARMPRRAMSSRSR